MLLIGRLDSYTYATPRSILHATIVRFKYTLDDGSNVMVSYTHITNTYSTISVLPIN